MEKFLDLGINADKLELLATKIFLA